MADISFDGCHVDGQWQCAAILDERIQGGSLTISASPDSLRGSVGRPFDASIHIAEKPLPAKLPHNFGSAIQTQDPLDLH
jgi:hypothetical protein